MVRLAREGGAEHICFLLALRASETYSLPKTFKMLLNYKLTLRKGGWNLVLRSWNHSKTKVFMRLWTFLREEKQSRTAGYLILSLMVIIDLVLLPKNFLKLKTSTLMNYSLQLWDCATASCCCCTWGFRYPKHWHQNSLLIWWSGWGNLYGVARRFQTTWERKQSLVTLQSIVRP